jgi:uncharacterized protein (TIGR02217 family)
MPDRFRDVYLPFGVPGFPCLSTPRFSTLLTAVDSGAEDANQRWQHPLYKFTLPEAVREHTVFEPLRDHWLIMAGPAHTWPFKDPLDFASVALTAANVAPAVSSSDQVIGAGDGAATQFQLVKQYSRSGFTYQRLIHLPRAGTVVVAVDGGDPAALSPPLGWTVSRPGGVVIFDGPVPNGLAVTAGFLFDNEVRFENDEAFDGIVQSYQVSGFADLTFIGVRPC